MTDSRKIQALEKEEGRNSPSNVSYDWQIYGDGKEESKVATTRRRNALGESRLLDG